MSTPAPLPPPAPVGWLFVLARWILFAGVLSLLGGSVTLLGYGASETVRHIVRIVGPGGLEISNREMFLASIKLIDLVLLATVLQVVAIGIYSMFIGRGLPVPGWLQASSIDGLKNLLASIVVVMLGVLFLEQVIADGGSPDLLAVGIGIAAIILALSYFIRSTRPPADRRGPRDRRQVGTVAAADLRLLHGLANAGLIGNGSPGTRRTWIG